VRLPTGTYEVWARSDDGWTWQRIEVSSGRATVLQFTGPVQRLRASALLHPAGWPGLVLCEPGTECTLFGAAVAAPLSALDAARGLFVAERMLPLPPAPEPVSWPPAADAGELAEFVLEDGAPAGAALFSLRRTATDSWQVLGVSMAGAERRFRLPRPGAGETWLLLVGRDHAPWAKPWSTAPAGASLALALARGVPLVVRATDPGGDPAVDVLVDYVPDGAAAAAVQARADGYGTVRLGPVLGPGTVRISDPRFANQEIQLDQVPLDGVRVTVSAGAALSVRAVAEDKPAAGIVVTVRDPSGRLRPAERAVVTDQDGAARFEGLSEGTGLVLFASVVRGGRTWSGRRANVLPGGEPVEVVLRDEDPVLPR
jgi:hypothetical protein